MRIAQVAPLHESVPPALYGGTERIVSYLTEELIALGHDVTLFASGDSRTAAHLIPMCERSLRLHEPDGDPLARHYVMIEQVFACADTFDVVHFHTDYTHYPLVRRHRPCSITTLHGRQNTPGLAALYREYAEIPVVSISHAQRTPLPHANWVATVHHGLPERLYRCGEGRGGYLAYCGRISPEKRPDLAIRIAREAGVELRIAAKVDRPDREYFETQVRPLLAEPGVVWTGEINDAQKVEFLGRACALLFPIQWPEPFGLVMIEAMACGTPVVAFPYGSVPEVLEHGVTGFITDGVADAVRAVQHLHLLDRARVRREFERRFTARRMAQDYAEVYRRLAGSGGRGGAPHPGWRDARAGGGELHGAGYGPRHRD